MPEGGTENMRSAKPVKRAVFLVLVMFVSAGLCLWGDEASAKEKKSRSGRSGKTEKVKYTKSPDGVPALIELSNSRKDMVKELDAETASYEKVKAALDGDKLFRGMTAEEARKRFGEPVNVDTWNTEDVTKWVYKKPSKDIMSKDKVYLIFDKDGKLEGWEEPK